MFRLKWNETTWYSWDITTATSSQLHVCLYSGRKVPGEGGDGSISFFNVGQRGNMTVESRLFRMCRASLHLLSERSSEKSKIEEVLFPPDML
jgi:hypothetical protein